MSTHTINLLQESVTAATTVPIYTGASSDRITGSGSHLFRRGLQVILDVQRAGTTGNLTVYGSDRSDPNGNPSAQNTGLPLAQSLVGDGATTNFQTAIAYVALSNYNWIVVSAGVILTLTTDYTLTNVGGLCRVDFGVAPVANAKIDVFYAVPVSLYASNDRVKRLQIRSYDFMWTVLPGGPASAATANLIPAGDN